MASPARKPPAGDHSDEALDILRRLEPVLVSINGEMADIKGDQRRQADTLTKLAGTLDRLDERQRKQGEDIAELKGRVSQLPNIWQLAGLIFAIFGAAFVLIHSAGGR